MDLPIEREAARHLPQLHVPVLSSCSGLEALLEAVEALGVVALAMVEKATALGKDLDELPGLQLELETEAEAILAAARDLDDA
jgi:hypothetical protein